MKKVVRESGLYMSENVDRSLNYSHKIWCIDIVEKNGLYQVRTHYQLVIENDRTNNLKTNNLNIYKNYNDAEKEYNKRIHEKMTGKSRYRFFGKNNLDMDFLENLEEEYIFDFLNKYKTD